jgi:hypothetical protein
LFGDQDERHLLLGRAGSDLEQDGQSAGATERDGCQVGDECLGADGQFDAQAVEQPASARCEGGLQSILRA